MPRDRQPGTGTDLTQRLHEGANALGLELDDAMRSRLLEFVALMRKWNAVYNLTAIRDPAAMLVHHVLDAIAILPALRRHVDTSRATLADVGSGAGVPGLPLAIVEPGLRVVSIEPVGKKSAFQRQVCTELALTNVEVMACRAEEVKRPCDVVTSRAFASLVDFVDASAGLVGPRTLLAAMKGQRTEADAEIAALPPDLAVEVEPVRVPFLEAERHLVFIRRRSGPRPS
jgi:16S rRNA (guanine527-N7)-methyltransferase